MLGEYLASKIYLIATPGGLGCCPFVGSDSVVDSSRCVCFFLLRHFCNIVVSVLFSLAIGDGSSTLIVFLLYCGCLCSVSLPYGAED